MNTFAGYGLFDSIGIAINRNRFRRDMLKALERANSFYCPAGRWPSRGWLLMSRGDYNNINKYSTSLELEIGQDNLGVLGNLAIVQAQCVTRGLASDTNALYLVEVTDLRGILLNKWFQYPINSQYNVRSPAYSEDYYDDTIDGSIPWTWDSMCENMWNQMGLGTWPGLPTSPTGTPEGFIFVGVPAWTAFCDILDHLGMTVTCDLTLSEPYSIVNNGDDDANFDTLTTKYLTNLEDDLEWIDLGAGRFPAEVVVLFRRRNAYYGTEETVRQDTLQWSTTPCYEVTVAAPAQFTGAVGVHHIWSDFTIRYSHDGNPVAADITTANTIAQERVLQYFARIYQTTGFMTRMYAGALPFSNGSQVDGVAWCQDYSSHDRQGWATKLVRGTNPPWPGLWEDGVYIDSALQEL